MSCLQQSDLYWLPPRSSVQVHRVEVALTRAPLGRPNGSSQVFAFENGNKSELDRRQCPRRSVRPEQYARSYSKGSPLHPAMPAG